MRDVLKRLERLEQTATRREPLRIVRQIIGIENGKPAPWNPAWARCDGATITRGDESPEAFEARALDHFAGNRLIIGSHYA